MSEENIYDSEESIAVLRKKKEHLESRLKNNQYTWYGWLISSVIGAGLILAVYPSYSVYGSRDLDLSRFLSRCIIGVSIGLFIYGYVVYILRNLFSGRLRRIEYELVQIDTDELKENIEENFFTKLVQINFKYLDQYYLQTQEQADKSFKLASFASISGLLIVVIGILMMLFSKTEPAYVTTGAGILSEFIAAIFFYLYNRTILKMSQYHQKLVITQNISLALKITDSMEKDQKIKSLELLIDRLTVDVNKYLTENK